MSFILSAQRQGPEEMMDGFRRYSEYLAANQRVFPAGALGLAQSDWYFNPIDHRCPHDAWLEQLTIHEPASGTRHEVRQTAIRIRLLGAYHDGYIELSYAGVTRYELQNSQSTRGHGDWRYDEFRLGSDGGVVHEIEWAGYRRWVIEAADVAFSWREAVLPAPVP